MPQVHHVRDDHGVFVMGSTEVERTKTALEHFARNALFCRAMAVMPGVVDPSLYLKAAEKLERRVARLEAEAIRARR